MMRHLTALLASLAMSLASCHAFAEGCAERPVHLVVGFAPGGGSDMVARSLTEELAQVLGQPIIVDNRPGAGGTVATRSVAIAEPDGCTLLLGSAAAFVINPNLMKTLPYDAQRDFAPVASVARFDYVLLARKDLPIRTLGDLVKYAKANPGKLTIGSAGNGSNTHLAAAAFASAAGIELRHVPYRGTSQALTDLLGGSIDLLFDSVPTVIGQVRAGSLRALASSGERREALLPELPTLAEEGVNYSASNWFAIFAPRATSPEMVARLNIAINKALASSRLKERFVSTGNLPMGGSAQDLAALVSRESATYKRIIDASKITLD